jgi:hypothetical protein
MNAVVTRGRYRLAMARAPESRSDVRSALSDLARQLNDLEHDLDSAQLQTGAAGLLAIGRIQVLAGSSRSPAARALSEAFPGPAKNADLLTQHIVNGNRVKKIGQIIGFLSEQPLGAEHAIAWMFQYLKEPREKEAVARAHLPGGKKIAGADLLAATQFFTEPYMVRYLVGKTLGERASRSNGYSRLRIVDPAAGGGSFLAESLRLFASTSRAPRRRVRSMLESVIAGYELDPTLAEIGSLCIWLTGVELAWPDVPSPPHIEFGCDGDETGFLAPSKLGDELSTRRGAEMVLLTNPPFLGRRLMSTSLRRWLSVNYPLAKNDLGAAFFLRCAALVAPGDRLGIVHQTNWMHLKTFSEFRASIFSQLSIDECAELGSGAFADLTGEKVRVALTVMSHGQLRRRSRFLRLVDLPLPEKREELLNPSPLRTFTVQSARVRSDIRSGIRYHFDGDLVRLLGALPTYDVVARPTQGTSTGNNKRSVRHSWQVPASQCSWRSASKGGGYSKWAGLNRWVVDWGREGEALLQNPGAALRNSSASRGAQLVFSDTGTQGLSVRLRQEGQVPIASGPGILVESGEPLSHLAVLNSRIVSALLKALTPKLTISAGYIARLPFPTELADDPELVSGAAQCVALKRSVLARKLGNDEYRWQLDESVDLEECITRAFLEEVADEAARLDLEWKLEQRVSRAFDFNDDARRRLEDEAGCCVSSLVGASFDADVTKVDAVLAASLDDGARYRSTGARRRGACEGPLEAACRVFEIPPQILLGYLCQRAPELKVVRQKYSEDLLHQAVLQILGFRSDRTWKAKRLSVRATATRVSDLFGVDSKTIRVWLEQRLPALHERTFYGDPILKLTDRDLVLARSAR